jgi:hypothetical protein
LKDEFVLVDESQVRRNPAEPKTANVFDAEIRGKTDQLAQILDAQLTVTMSRNASKQITPRK